MASRATWNKLSLDEQRQRFEHWQSLRSRYETLLMRGPPGVDGTTYRKRLAELKLQVDEAEQDLLRTAPGLSTGRFPEPDTIVARVAARLPAGSALVEIVWVEPFRFERAGTAGRRDLGRYVALLLFPDQRIDVVDLGVAQHLDVVVQQFLGAIRSPSNDPKPQARELYRQIFAPLISRLHGARRLVWSADGSLNLVPMAALHNGVDYLLEGPYQFTYVASGRDLLQDPVRAPMQQPLVIADPDYQFASPPRVLQLETEKVPIARLAYLSRLPGALREAESVAHWLGVQPITGKAATEALLRQARSPAVLHIATHGLFLDDASPSPQAVDSVERGAAEQTRKVVALPLELPISSGGVPMAARSSILSRSVLALAGASTATRSSDSSQDGLLTSEEARTLNLFGTQLVVLSACDTGRGTVQIGEGVQGMRRSFIMAGAETVVASLWTISDDKTAALMDAYYRRLVRDNRPRVQALSDAMKTIRTSHPHPYYWAPFIAMGRDEPLRLDLAPR